MNLILIKTIKEILSKHNANPLKLMGQNFLVNKPTLNKIIVAAELTKKDTVLEIGPGIGTLTEALSKEAGKVIAVEKDKTMVDILKTTLQSYNNIKIVQGDALKFNAESYKLKSTRYKLVANLPYYITSPLIRKFLESKSQPEIMVLMVQKEVAQRICAQLPRMSLLSVSVQFYAKAEIVSFVPRNYFWPSPKVDSAIIKITPKIGQELPKIDVDLFFKVVKAGFSQPRKQLINNLSKKLKKDKSEINRWLLKNSINPHQRAETLSIEKWIELANSF